jgi:S-adenosylmethionine-diacylglycerol 3-amino-3-carboxypropyl transferase
LADFTASIKRATANRLDKAVHHNKALSQSGLRERLFTATFQGLVYPQIWEDPVVDLEALAIKPGDHIVAIASGGCNILSYLIADPGRITAVDLNHAHIALNKLKLTAVRCLPSHWHYSNFFAHANLASNVPMFDEYIAPHLDGATRSYWSERDFFGRRRISAFARGFYKTGLLGRFIGASHFLSRLLGVDAKAITNAKSLLEQQEYFENVIAPVFDHWLMRTILKHPASLYGLGIPPAQYAALAADHPGGLPEVLRARARKLACGFLLKDNYFARQAFGRGYDVPGNGALPPYLQSQNFGLIRARAHRVDVRHESVTDYLAGSPEGSVDAYVLLDAQDWMDTRQLTDLWQQINRSAAPGARVIFRTAADERLLPGKIPEQILSGWTYDIARSKELNTRDRSSIYGAFHLYTRNAGVLQE